MAVLQHVLSVVCACTPGSSLFFAYFPTIHRMLSVVCWLLLLTILAAEATIAPPTPAVPNCSALALLLRRSGSVLVQLLAFVSLAYLCLTGFYALYRAARFEWYLLVPGHSPSYSLCRCGKLKTQSENKSATLCRLYYM